MHCHLKHGDGSAGGPYPDDRRAGFEAEAKPSQALCPEEQGHASTGESFPSNTLLTESWAKIKRPIDANAICVLNLSWPLDGPAVGVLKDPRKNSEPLSSQTAKSETSSALRPPNQRPADPGSPRKRPCKCNVQLYRTYSDFLLMLIVFFSLT